MIPEPVHALQVIMGTLMTDIAPNMRDEYRQANVNLLAFAMMLISQEYDRAAEVRLAENREMRTLFGRAANVVEDPRLAERLAAAASESDADVRVSRLSAANNDLRRLLIELHAAAEQCESPEARAIVRSIWEFLRNASARRTIEVG